MRLSDILQKYSEESSNYRILDGTIIDVHGPRNFVLGEEMKYQYLDIIVHHNLPPEKIKLTYTEKFFRKEVLHALGVSSLEELLGKLPVEVKVAYDIRTGEKRGLFIDEQKKYILKEYKPKD